VLILPAGHGRAVARRRRLSARERLGLGAVGALTAALAALVVIALASSGAPGRGCVQVTIASSLGGQPLSGCGARARSICAAAAGGAYAPAAAEAVLSACRRAGLRERPAASGSAGR